MPQSQSQPTATQVPSTDAGSQLCYDFRKGDITLRRITPMYPYRSIMVDKHGHLTRGIWQVDDPHRPNTMESAWLTKQLDQSAEITVIPETLPFSLRTGDQITPLDGSFALIADGDGNVQWEMRKVADDGSITTTSGIHCQEEPEGTQSAVADNTEVPE